MAETVTCTECGASLKVAALPAPGKKVRCPKCGEPFLPGRREEDEERERDDDRPAAKPRRQRDDDDDDDDREAAPRRRGGRRRHSFEFDGSAGDFFVVYLLTFLLTLVTLGLAFPWTICMYERWKIEHTVVEGRRLRFDGSGLGLLGHFIVIYLLCIITLGIYMFWAVPKICRWIADNTSFADER